MRARAAQTALTASAWAAAVLLVPALSPAQPDEAETTPGVSAERILFGQSAAFSGPAAELGRGMRLGIQAAFKEANDAGGVHGRRLELVTVDDGYEPEAAISNTRRLIEDEGVFALVGGVGTPTSRSAVPVAEEAGVPYIAPFTGAGFLRGEPHVINLRASYAQETEEMVERLTRDLGIERIAVVIQNDSFGARRPCGRSCRVRQTEHGGGRHRRLSAQHDRRQDGDRRHRGGAAGGRHHRGRLPAGGQPDRLGPAHRPGSGVHDPVLRGQQCPRGRTRSARRRRLRHPGRAVSERAELQSRHRLPARAARPYSLARSPVSSPSRVTLPDVS